MTLALLVRVCAVAREWTVTTDALNRVRTVRLRARLLADGVHGFDARFKPVLIIAINTGRRLGEIMGLTWPQIDQARGMILLVSTKNGKPRDVPINAPVAEVRAGLPSGDDRVFTFPSMKATYQWRRITKRPGIRALHFHDPRHPFATRIADQGCDPFTIKELLGHSRLKPTERYRHAL